jgi:hypothetical protein
MHAIVRILMDGRLGGRFFTVLMFCALLFAGAPAAWCADAVGKAESASGTVSVEREGKTEALKTGGPIYLHDSVKTGANSSVELVFLDESRVKMAESTVMEITEYLFNPSEKTRQGLLSMVSGKARFVVQDLQDYKDKRFRVQTQTAVVGTRDTDFVVSFDPRSKGHSGCREGFLEAFCAANAIVAFSKTHPDKVTLLTANMLSQMCGTDPPSPGRFVSAAERKRIMQGVEQMGGQKPPPLLPGVADKGTDLQVDQPVPIGTTTTTTTTLAAPVPGPTVPSSTTSSTTSTSTTTTTSSTTSSTSSSTTSSTSTSTSTSTTSTTSTTQPRLPPPPPPPN